ncbi:MAG TPA: right-handed parallel beta-helix repeat-containing protein [Segetibacter sp.]|nr:right-handed parallel beta-helix repeat-containing protein [Segetibacter sp.]
MKDIVKVSPNTILPFVALFLLITIFPVNSFCQKFVHPGINQNSKDLEYMKAKVLKGEEPYKGAFERLKAVLDTGFTTKPFTHVLRGPYGKPNIGGDDLSKGANMAYNYALAGYITQNKRYSDKAIEIINAWSPVLWDFDYNDAKLLAAWTGHLLCNAAEILRYSNSGWQKKDIDKFTHMLMTVYYPLMRYYYVQANGNWDGAIIHSIIAMAIFTDNRTMFSNAIDHFLHAPVNGSLFKYIYPTGQCQETMRDQGHVQLGLGEFAGAAQVAFTQGVDLFSISDNRLALGYEYTAGFLLGKKPHSYGTISERAKNLRDDYEYVYRHYSARGVNVPNTKQAADSVRAKASRSVLTSVRAPMSLSKASLINVKASTIGNIAGASSSELPKPPLNAINVFPGQSVQQAVDSASTNGGWVVIKAGIHKLPASLKIPGGVTLSGEGLHSVLFLDPASDTRDAIVNASDDLHDITIRDLVIEGSNKTDPGTDPNSNRSYRGGYNRGGIILRASREGQMKRIHLTNLTVQNCTFNGVLISGGDDIQIERCNFNENGSNVIPGPKLQHNLLLTHCKNVDIKDSRFDTSPFGSGIALDHDKNVKVSNCEIARNGHYGVLISESKDVAINANLIEANDRSGVMAEFLDEGCNRVIINNNLIQYNNGFGVESYSAINSKVENNRYFGNGNNTIQQKISDERKIVMQ